MRVSRTLKLDSVTWLKVKGEKKKRGEGEERAGESDQEAQWSSDKKMGELEIQFRKLGVQKDERRIPQESLAL